MLPHSGWWHSRKTCEKEKSHDDSKSDSGQGPVLFYFCTSIFAYFCFIGMTEILIQQTDIAGTGQNQETKTQSVNPMWVACTQVLEPSFATSQGVCYQEAGIKNGVKHSSMGCGPPTWQPNLLLQKPTSCSFYNNLFFQELKDSWKSALICPRSSGSSTQSTCTKFHLNSSLGTKTLPHESLKEKSHSNHSIQYNSSSSWY